MEKYIKKKNENLQKDAQAVGSEKDGESAQPSNAKEDGKPDDAKEEDSKSENKENHNVINLSIISDEDKEADREALEKITNMIEERLKTRPLPSPPAQAAPDGPANSEQPSKARDGDSDADTVNNGELEKWTEGSFLLLYLSVITVHLFIFNISGFMFSLEEFPFLSALL